MGCVAPQKEKQQAASFPTKTTMVKNFLVALKEEAKSRLIEKNKISEEETNQRYSICEKCEFFHAPTKRCQKCGCFLKWKTSWKSQKCPIGKW